MSLSLAHRHQIRRQCNAGVPHGEIASEFGVTLAAVLNVGHVDRIGRRRSLPRQAAPLPVLRNLDWKSTRPAVETYLASERCKYPAADGCEHERVPGYPYCEHHRRLCYSRQRA